MERERRTRPSATRTLSAMACGCISALSMLMTQCSMALDFDSLRGGSDADAQPRDTSSDTPDRSDLGRDVDGSNAPDRGAPDRSLPDNDVSDDRQSAEVEADTSATDDGLTADVADTSDTHGSEDGAITCDADVLNDRNNCGTCGKRCCGRCVSGTCVPAAIGDSPKPKIIGTPINGEFFELFVATTNGIIVALPNSPPPWFNYRPTDVGTVAVVNSTPRTQIFWSASDGIWSLAVPAGLPVQILDAVRRCEAMAFEPTDTFIYAGGCWDANGRPLLGIHKLNRHPNYPWSTITTTGEVTHLVALNDNSRKQLLYIARNDGLYSLQLNDQGSPSQPVRIRASRAPQGMGASLSSKSLAWVDSEQGEVFFYQSVAQTIATEEDRPQAATSDDSWAYWGNYDGTIRRKAVTGQSAAEPLEDVVSDDDIPVALTVDSACVYVLTQTSHEPFAGRIYGLSKLPK